MDASKYKRRAIQTGRQTTKIDLGSPQPVPEVLPARTQTPQPNPVEGPHSLPQLAPDAVNRIRTQRSIARSEPHLRPRQRQQARTISEFVANPLPLKPSKADTGYVERLAPNRHSMAETVTRLAVTLPETIVPPQTNSQLPAVEAPPQPVAPVQPRQRLPGIDMELPGEESHDRHPDSLIKGTKLMAARRWAFRGLAAGLVLFIIGGGLLFSQGYLKLHKVFRGGTGTAEALKEKVDPNLLKGEGSGRINVLLLGRGGGAHDAPDLTDTIMLASIDPVNHKTTLFSIPRDLWVNVPSAGNMKINAVYQTGVFTKLGKRVNNSTDKEAVTAGFNLVDQTVEEVLGVNISYNVMIDFAAFSQAIDTVGGLGINVPTDLVDPTMAWENKNDPVLAKAGPQVFDGKHALIYVRSRETTSDFARSERQRSVLLGLKTKVDTLGTLSNPAKLSGLMNAFGNNAQTDLSLKNASRLYNITKRISSTNTVSVGFADPPNQFVTTGNITGQSVVLPKAGLFKYSDIQTFVRGQLKDPYILKEKAKIVVLNGTTVPGVATAKAEELRSYGYNVIKSGDTPTTGWTQTTLVNLNKNRNKYTAHYLEQRLGGTTTNTLPDNAIQTNGADFVIIIGSDKATPQ